MFAMVWLLFGTVLVGTLLLMLPVETERKVQPNGRELQVPRVLRADRPALYLVVAALDLLAAAAFLMWPTEAFGAGRSGYFTVIFLATALSVAPLTCWLVGSLDAASKPVDGGAHR